MKPNIYHTVLLIFITHGADHKTMLTVDIVTTICRITIAVAATTDNNNVLIMNDSVSHTTTTTPLGWASVSESLGAARELKVHPVPNPNRGLPVGGYQ